MLYTWRTESEDRDSSTTHLVLTELFELDCLKLPLKGLTFHTYMRWLKHFAPEDSAGFRRILKIHNLYASYNPSPWAGLRFGRQFLSQGVGRGCIDGGTVSIEMPRTVRAVGFVGSDVSHESLSVEPVFENLVWGGHILSGYVPGTDVSASYIKRSVRDTLSEEKAGLEARFRPLPELRPFVGLTYDLAGSSLNKWYLGCSAQRLGDFSGYMKYTYLEPVFKEGSFFSNLPSKAHSRVRAAATYFPGWMGSVTAAYVASILGAEASHYVELSAELARASLGLNHSFGFGGERTGGFALGNYQVARTLLLSGGVEYARYGLSTLEDPPDREDDLAVHLGADLHLPESVDISMRVEYLVNEDYFYDIRFLSSVSLAFGR